MKILVAIVNHGTKSRPYLDRLLSEYRSMPFEVKCVVLSDTQKDLGPDVEVRVGAPTSDPWSLPFPHKKLFVQNQNDYDLFIYTEDDMLVTQRHIEAFLRVTEFLHDDEIAGFMQSEQGPDGRLFCPEAHGVYHWVPGSPRRRGPYVFAIYSNHHAACYMLSRRQLKRAIESGGFDVGPHEERYDLLVSAATDPYVQCGLTKLICISHVDDFIVSHLPNRYLDYGMEYSELRLQINEMLTGDHNGTSHAELMQTETRLPKMPFSKNYYEPVRNEFLQLMPKTARNVLSIGCGSGKTEQRVMETGRAVFGIPLDRVIGAVARSKGVRVSEPNLETALREMGDQRFDCVLCDWILHLWPEPSSLLKWISDRMSSDGVLLAVVPNLNHFRPLWRRWRGRSGYQDLGDYDRAGLHKATRRQLRAWLKNAGFKVDRMTTIVPDHHQTMSRLAGPLGTELFATQIVVRARRG